MTTTPIICINLLRATERKKDILDQWVNTLQTSVEFIEAVDRKDIKNTNNSKLSDGEIACIMSHISAYEHIKKQDYEQAIIIEDDAIPLFSNSNQLYLTIDSANQEFENIDILLLHNPRHWKYAKSILCRKKHSSLISGNPNGTYGYLIKNKTIELMKHKLLSLTMPADHYWFLFGEQQTLAMLNRPLIDHPVSDATTYINRPRDKRRKYIE